MRGMQTVNNKTRKALAAAVEMGGGPARVGEVAGVSRIAVFKWMKKGRLPRTDYTGETDHAGSIVKAVHEFSGKRISRKSLL